MRQRGRATALAVVTVIGMIGAACSSDRDEAPTAASVGADTSGAEVDAARFGDIASPCGGGDATGSTDQGVSDDAVRVGYGDDAGSKLMPGLGHEISDAVEAMLEWCNGQGGINGREVVGTYYDAEITEVNRAITGACEREFFLVGSFWVLDGTIEPIRRECGLPAVPASVASAAFANAPLMVAPVPNPGDRAFNFNGIALAELFPDEVQRSGVVYTTYPAALDQRDKNVPALEPAGWIFDPACKVEYNALGEASWLPLAEKLRDCGAEMVYLIGGAPSLESLRRHRRSSGTNPSGASIRTCTTRPSPTGAGPRTSPTRSTSP